MFAVAVCRPVRKGPSRLKTIVLIAAVAVVSAQAQPGRGSYMQFHPLLSALDANHDDVIDEEELAKAPAALRALDRNADGQIAPHEMSPMMGRGRGGPDGRGGRGRQEEGPQGPDAVEEAVKTYLAFDKNSDGKLAREELPERMQGIFEHGDTNHDGVLTADELRVMARAQQPAGGGMRGAREAAAKGLKADAGRKADAHGSDLAALDTNRD